MIKRNTSTQESRDFWKLCEETAKKVKSWPDWKREACKLSSSKEIKEDWDEYYKEGKRYSYWP